MGKLSLGVIGTLIVILTFVGNMWLHDRNELRIQRDIAEKQENIIEAQTEISRRQTRITRVETRVVERVQEAEDANELVPPATAAAWHAGIVELRASGERATNGRNANVSRPISGNSGSGGSDKRRTERVLSETGVSPAKVQRATGRARKD